MYTRLLDTLVGLNLVLPDSLQACSSVRGLFHSKYRYFSFCNSFHLKQAKTVILGRILNQVRLNELSLISSCEGDDTDEY